MSQGYVETVPVNLSALESLPVRTNMLASQTNNKGNGAPSNPLEGQWWVDDSNPLSIDLKIFLNGTFVTIIQNLLAGAITPSDVTKFVHEQPGAAGSWIVNHNLGTDRVVVQVYDNTGNMIIPNSIVLAGPNSLQINFNILVAGHAVVMG